MLNSGGKGVLQAERFSKLKALKCILFHAPSTNVFIISFYHVIAENREMDLYLCSAFLV